ncbi:uncharacterized protein VP01_3665g1, partial [Puccinia sorghi]
MKWISRTRPRRVSRTDPPSSIFLTFLTGIIGNPNNRLAGGAVKINLNSLGIMQQMMDAEATRLLKLQERVKQLESFEASLFALEGSRQPPQTSAIPAVTHSTSSKRG